MKFPGLLLQDAAIGFENFLIHDFGRIVLVNEHGGNIASMQKVPFEVQETHWQGPVVWNSAKLNA